MIVIVCQNGEMLRGAGEETRLLEDASSAGKVCGIPKLHATDGKLLGLVNPAMATRGRYPDRSPVGSRDSEGFSICSSLRTRGTQDLEGAWDLKGAWLLHRGRDLVRACM